jgi:hypothetical protein
VNSEENDTSSNNGDPSIPGKSLIFISHDTRDAGIAEAFSALLKSVSAGVLKSFRSSDKKGNQGIEFGVEWYPEIMKKLELASDVVCLLTPNSVNRPWILYEAGVAKGKLETPVHGVALGIALQAASSGPFAQFQNSDDTDDSLTQLVMQLVSRIPNAEPDRDVVKTQVAAFKSKIEPLLNASDGAVPQEQDNEEASVAKLFEEVKVMFQDLPSRIERRFDPEYSPAIRNKKRFSSKVFYELSRDFDKEMPDGIGLLIVASQFKDEFPWLYELAVDAYRQMAENGDALEALGRLDRALHLTFHHPMMREIGFRSKDRFMDAELMMESMLRAISFTRDRFAHRSAPIASGWTDDRVETLQSMWNDGKTATQIAKALGGVNRNAVIGKAHRMGLKPSSGRENLGDEDFN